MRPIPRRAADASAGAEGAPAAARLPKDDGERSVIAGNVLDRQFTADAPSQEWVADITYIWTAAGWLYVAAVIDLFSRRVVGFSNERDDDGTARHRS